MSKKVKALLVTLLVAMVMGFSSCSFLPSNKYDVWTFSEPAVGWSLDDGYYAKAELTTKEFQDLVADLDPSYKHRWTEDKIYDWFIGCGFGEKEAEKESAWLTTTDHCLLVSREGADVKIIVK